jgi:radical SAM enzyme (rSAM/lipoprotein system)
VFPSLKKIAFRQFRKYEINRHELNYLFWECTTRCNLNCLHCGSDCSKDSAFRDMPVEDFLSALDKIKEPPGNFIVVMTGGEPLLRDDIELCGREIRKKSMRWSLVSNGLLYNKERHISLLNAGMGALTLSLDGLETSHNWLRNSKSCFSKVVNAIELAASSTRLNFDVVTCVNKRNINELSQIHDFLKQRGVKAWRLFTITPIGRAANKPDLLLADSQFVELMDFITESRKTQTMDVKFSCEGFVGRYELKVRDGYFFCRAGTNIGSVLIDGSISACPNIDRSFIQGNIYRDNLWEVWQSEFKPFRDREWAKTGQCNGCSYFNDCQGNGLHHWHGDKKNVLVCYNNKLQFES